MEKPKKLQLDTIQEYSKKRRLGRKKSSNRRSLYSIAADNIIAIATHGYTQYILPIDRVLWRDDEISFTKWKLVSAGFKVDHRGQPSSWEHLFSKLFDRPYEYLVISWSWNSEKPKRHFQWD